MKKLFEYCHQLRPYADSYGLMLVELEEGETKEDVIKEIVKPRRFGYVNYSFIKSLNEYTLNEGAISEKTYKGNLMLFETQQDYND